MGPIGVCALFQRLRAGDRGNRRPYGRGPGPGRGSGQPRPAGPQGPVRLAGQPRGRPAAPPTGPRGRRAGRGRLGHRHGPDRPAYPPPAGHSWPGLDRVLHLRAAVLRGVLHPWGDWEGRAGHPPHGRQHPAVHRHRGAGAEGDLRHRRAARQLHRHRPRRHHPPLRPQHRRGPDGAVDADPGPAAGTKPAPAGGRRSPPHPAAREADLHLAIRPGTNLALLNGLLRELIEHGWIDRAFIDAHTVGFDQLAQTVQPYDPERVAGICGVPADQVREAARLLGTGEQLVSTVLQGVYQSTGATAAACQVNNLQLLRGMIGRPGCGVLQMNGQPTAQNTRETGADGDLPGFRNWDNEAHVRELAELWNVDPIVIPHWAPPTHAMQIWRYAEQGSIGLLWTSATNPAVSLPELGRIRSILASEELFVVVQDAFLTETARYADVVLPTAIWGEKTGTFTNADRTVHLSERAVDPPGEARSDLAIFLDYAHRMDLRDRDGQPLIKWHDAESAFEAWKACSAGRPCDYTGLSYAKLRDAGGIQWPCNDQHPDGTERLYTDMTFNTDPEVCEDYGHDLLTGAVTTQIEYRAANPAG